MLYDKIQKGTHTQSDSSVKELVKVLDAKSKTNGTSFLSEVSSFIRSLEDKSRSQNKMDFFRKRTASEIIKSSFQTGCTDRGIVFLTLVREHGIPAVFVETLQEKSLSTRDAGLKGHVFTNVYNENTGSWNIYDPITGFQDKYDGGYIPVCMGMDFSALYMIETSNKLSNSPIVLDSLGGLKEVAQNCNVNVKDVTFGDFDFLKVKKFSSQVANNNRDL